MAPSITAAAFALDARSGRVVASHPMASTASRIDLMLSTLNAADVGTLESIAAKLEQVKDELEQMERPELAARAVETLAALRRGDVAEFKRGRAFLQSKIGHLK